MPDDRESTEEPRLETKRQPATTAKLEPPARRDHNIVDRSFSTSRSGYWF